jgi:hypothetical protein
MRALQIELSRSVGTALPPRSSKRRLLSDDAGLQTRCVRRAFVDTSDAYRMAAEACCFAKVAGNRRGWIARDRCGRNQRSNSEALLQGLRTQRLNGCAALVMPLSTLTQTVRTLARTIRFGR